jgi:hypothetical protein
MKRHPVTQPSDPSYRFIPLTQGQNTIVDTKDFPLLAQWPWYARWDSHTRSFYAVRTPRRGANLVHMAQTILRIQSPYEADHINHDTLDNRRCNLRPATRAQQMMHRRKGANNTSGFKGVSWDKSRSVWHVGIGVEGRWLNIGRFDTAEEAARAYDEAAKQYHGEFAHLNFASPSVLSSG